MAGYKGYEIEYGDSRAGWIISPVRERIAHFQHVKGEFMPYITSNVAGIDVRKDYKTLEGIVKDFAEQHRVLIGEDDEGEQILEPSEAKVIISGTVGNLHLSQNSLGIQITPSQVEHINSEIDKASPAMLKKVLKEWIPQAFMGSGIGKLLGMLGL